MEEIRNGSRSIGPAARVMDFNISFGPASLACDSGQFSRSTDGGGVTWQTPINIPNSPQWGTLDVDTNGNLFLGGESNQFWCVRSSNAQIGDQTPTFDRVTAGQYGWWPDSGRNKWNRTLRAVVPGGGPFRWSY